MKTKKWLAALVALCMVLLASCDQATGDSTNNPDGQPTGSENSLNDYEKKIAGKIFVNGTKSYEFASAALTGKYIDTVSANIRAATPRTFKWKAEAGTGGNIKVTITMDNGTSPANVSYSESTGKLTVDGTVFDIKLSAEEEKLVGKWRWCLWAPLAGERSDEGWVVFGLKLLENKKAAFVQTHLSGEDNEITKQRALTKMSSELEGEDNYIWFISGKEIRIGRYDTDSLSYNASTDTLKMRTTSYTRHSGTKGSIVGEWKHSSSYFKVTGDGKYGRFVFPKTNTNSTIENPDYDEENLSYRGYHYEGDKLYMDTLFTVNDDYTIIYFTSYGLKKYTE